VLGENCLNSETVLLFYRYIPFPWNRERGASFLITPLLIDYKRVNAPTMHYFKVFPWNGEFRAPINSYTPFTITTIRGHRLIVTSLPWNGEFTASIISNLK
jgi:hypothetical protein